MNLLKKKVDLHAELLAVRERQMRQNEIMATISVWMDSDVGRRDDIRKKLASHDRSQENLFEFDLLVSDRIFHIDQIRKVCIDYRLRFLASQYFKGGIPNEAVTQIRRLEDKHSTSLDGFKIVAPSKTFQLKNFNDPLLFAPIGNGYFYLIHKWGNDLDSWRRIWVWPYRNLFTFTLVVLSLSLIVTWLTPESNLSRKVPMAGVIIFLFAFKSIFAVGLYCFFMLGKKFNCDIWDSEFFN